MKFEAIYRENFSRVWRTVRRLGIAEKDALDVAQEVFMVAYRRRNDYDPRAAMSTWLYGIAYRVVADCRRKASARFEVLGEGEQSPILADWDPSQQLEHRERLRLLELVLDSLPFEQRAVITMFEMEGLSGEEIAAALGVPVGTVRSRLRLARMAFAESAAGWSQHGQPPKAIGGL